jgi:protein required for attachment to host cells
MSRTCVVVADRVRARFFVVDPPPEHRPAGEPCKLREVEALTDSEGALKGNDVFSNRRSGTNRSPGGTEFEYDDHRLRHREEVERRFAKRIAQALGTLVRGRSAEKLVLAAEPRMLGLLRPELNGHSLGGADLIELPENLSNKTPEQIQSALARRGVLPSNSR